jgi:uncharacterized protein YndB with AHSA1/START domain
MWSYEHTLECPATPEAVWRVYTDTATWPQWNAGVGQLDLDGSFEAGTHGRLTPRDQEPLPFVLVSAKSGRGYISETQIADTVVLRTSNTLEALPDGGTRIIAQLSMHGAAADFFGTSFGPAFAAGVPDTVRALAERAGALEAA